VVDQDEDMHDVYDEEGREVGEDGAPPAGVQQVPRRERLGVLGRGQGRGARKTPLSRTHTPLSAAERPEHDTHWQQTQVGRAAVPRGHSPPAAGAGRTLPPPVRCN
jgi:hypothetical protein